MQTSSLKYLNLLSEKYPSIQAASTAIINLTAQLQLPKGTEHFLSDIHGEYESFQHVIRNGAGSICRKIDEMFGNTMSKSERRNIATLIYYPELKTPMMLQSVPDKDEWSRLTLVRLVKFCRRLCAKYRRETVRNLLPKHAAETLEELLYDQAVSYTHLDVYKRQACREIEKAPEMTACEAITVATVARPTSG